MSRLKDPPYSVVTVETQALVALLFEDEDGALELVGDLNATEASSLAEAAERLHEMAYSQCAPEPCTSWSRRKRHLSVGLADIHDRDIYDYDIRPIEAGTEPEGAPT